MKFAVELGGDYARLLQGFKGFTEFRRKFRTTALRRMAQAHKKQIRARLLTKKSGPDGESWAPWSPRTRAQRARKGTLGQGLLLDDRKLVNSFKVAFSASKGTLATPLPYAGRLHFGDPSKNLPARPFAGVGRGDLRPLQATLNKWVAKHLPL